MPDHIVLTCSNALLRKIVKTVGPKKKACSPEGKQAFCRGRRDWTRTNDPHHVKVTYVVCEANENAGLYQTMYMPL